MTKKFIPYVLNLAGRPPAGGIVPDGPYFDSRLFGTGIPHSERLHSGKDIREFAGDRPELRIPVADGRDIGGHGLQKRGTVMVEDEKAAGKNLWFKRSGAQMHVGEARQEPLRVLERARYGEIRTIQCFFANRGAKGLEKPLLVIAVLNELTGR